MLKYTPMSDIKHKTSFVKEAQKVFEYKKAPLKFKGAVAPDNPVADSDNFGITATSMDRN